LTIDEEKVVILLFRQNNRVIGVFVMAWQLYSLKSVAETN